MATSPRVAFFAAATFALLLAASASPPPAVQRDVGDVKVRTTMVPSAGTGTLTQWAEGQRFHVGDVLDFKSWNGAVLLLARGGDYLRCHAAASPARRFAGGGGGGTEFVLNRPGTFYFASAVPGRCEAGRRMAVRVVDAPFDFFAPTSGVDPGTTAPPPPPPPPTVVFKLTPSAWLWIATTGLFAALLICVTCFFENEQDKLSKHYMDKLGASLEFYKGLSAELAASASV